MSQLNMLRPNTIYRSYGINIERVEVTLFENCDNPTQIGQPTTTNGEGFYEFSGLDCGKEYRVQFGDAGDIYSYTEPDSCTDGDPNIPPDEQDRDCTNPNGFSGCIEFLDPVNSPNNPTIDCGYVCEGEIGGYVWLDTNDNTGCQDEDEKGIAGVTVNLFEVEGCQDVSGETPSKTTKTNADGEYLFTGLCPGDYRVTFDDPLGRDNTVANQNCPELPPGGSGDTKDSDCGTDDECVTLTAPCPLVAPTSPVITIRTAAKYPRRLTATWKSPSNAGLRRRLSRSSMVSCSSSR